MSIQVNRAESYVNASFCRLCNAFLEGMVQDITTVTTPLDSIALDLAQKEDLRLQMGANSPSIWLALRRTWEALAVQVASSADESSIRTLVATFARFTRNLVAGVPSNQEHAFENEPSLRRILHTYSSWSATQDPNSYLATRMLIQALSNIVTTHDNLMSRLWETYMTLPEEQTILTRLLGSPDAQTILSLLVLMINCIHESDHRRALLAETKVGGRVCIALLDLMVTLYDAENSSDGGKAFDFGYHLFAHLFDGGFAPKLYGNLKVAEEVTAPHQTILLKLLDSYLQSSHSSTSLLVGMCPMLTTCFFELSAFSTEAIRKAMGNGSAEHGDVVNDDSPDPGSLDLLLPKACEALVLVTQCLVSIMLEFEEISAGDILKEELQLLIRGAVSPHGRDIAVSTVELLRLLDIFLPRINFGKPVVSQVTDQGTISSASTDPTGFSYLKRDLVRLLGILCHKDRRIQDSIRNCNGIILIMNMCVVDERNPYLREHAIFTLHNLLEDNEENQAVVNCIQPSEKWDQNGMLQK